MKIEILEQAYASYLKNCEGCIMTTNNWTVSKFMLDSISAQQMTFINDAIDEVNRQLAQSLGKSIFKKNKDTQLIKQCEIDVVGLRYKNGINEVFLYDTAFHEDGLNYKDGVANVLKKLVRAFIIGELFFKGFKVHIGFLTPKCKRKDLNKINNELPKLIGVMQKYNPDIVVEVLLDSDCEDIIDKLVSCADDISDSNDLFIRSVKLLQSAKALPQSKQTNNNIGTSNLQKGAVANNNSKSNNKTKIFTIVDFLTKSNLFTQELVQKLCDANYSKQALGLKYPFMKELKNIPSNENCRYYATVITLNGKCYKICNDWYVKQLERLDEWFKNIAGAFEGLN